MFRKSILLLLVFVLLSAAGAVFSEGAALPPETPAPARIHVPPEATAEPPVILNRIRDRNCMDGFRFRLDARMLHIWFPDIMSADEAILLYDGEAWLIDCGDEKAGSRGAELLRKLGVTRISKLFNTHPHHDHINGLANTDAAVPVERLYVCFPPDATDSMVNAMVYAAAVSIPVEEYGDGDTFAMGDGKVSLTFWCNGDPSLDMNNNSAVTLLQYGDRRMLFTADMEQAGQSALLARLSPQNLRADILKYPHHGKKALLDSFLDAVSPSVAVITNAQVQWAGEQYLSWNRIPYYFTSMYTVTGNYLHLYTDGNVWVIEYIPFDSVEPWQE